MANSLRPAGSRHAWLSRRRVTLAGLVGLVVAAAVVLPMRGPRNATADFLTLSDPMFVNARLVEQWLGRSGQLRALMARSDESWLGPWLQALGMTPSPALPGVHMLKWAAPDGLPLVLLSLIPFQEKRGAFLNGYHLGFWPRERQRRKIDDERLPEGFIAVTAENQSTQVSTHFRLSDFLTKDQPQVWPKLLVLKPELLDKLELVVQELQAEGKPCSLKILSGFRSPQYNARRVPPRGARAKDSRHMYGDAADVYVDANDDGRMDDLTGDGRVTLADAKYLLAVADRIESRHAELTGGLGAYPGTGAAGPFVHIDARGTRARW